MGAGTHLNAFDFHHFISDNFFAVWVASGTTLAYSHRRQFALSINDGKQEETRQLRADKAIAMLLAGKTVN